MTLYGFRKRRSTVDAINVVVNTARKAIEDKRWKRGSKKYCAIITLDIKNAFNSAKWRCIQDALQKLRVPLYIRRIVADCFSRRVLRYNIDNDPKEYKVTSGVPQGSVLGMYDDILSFKEPDEAKVIGFADDIALVVVAPRGGNFQLSAMRL